MTKRRGLLIFVIVYMLGLLVYLGILAGRESTPASADISTSYNGIQILPDVQKDAIPTLNQPAFLPANSQLTWLSDDDLVLMTSINGQAKAYPIKLLNWHGIVNDSIGERAVVVTYNPLTNYAAMFSSEVNGTVYEFRNTGALYESSLVMFDTETDTYYSQILQKGIRGENIEAELQLIPSAVISVAEFRQQFSNGEIMSIDTGYARNYLDDPYLLYRDIDSDAPFPVSNYDTRLPNKTVVLGLENNGQARAYNISEFAGLTVRDTLGGQTVEILVSPQGDFAQAFIVNGDNRVPAPAVTSYWFAWALTHPDTGIASAN